MLRIGLTGGIGSGKSTVAAIFEVLGIAVYYADAAAKKLMNEDEDVRESIQNYFGKNSYHKGILNREYLAGIVFKDEEKLALLNSIIHPATIKDAAAWVKNQTSPYVIKEAALLFESGSNKSLHFVIGVKAPLPLRINRAMNRDNLTKAQVEDRISKQMQEEMKLGLCNYIINNDEKEMIIPQVFLLHEKFLNYSKSK